MFELLCFTSLSFSSFRPLLTTCFCFVLKQKQLSLAKRDILICLDLGKLFSFFPGSGEYVQVALVEGGVGQCGAAPGTKSISQGKELHN